MTTSFFGRWARRWPLACAISMLGPQTAASQSLGTFSESTDIGPVRIPGTAEYDATTETYRIGGSGTNMWFDSDEFQFVWMRLDGDFILRTHAEFVGDGVDPHRKIGWMIRAGLEGDAAYVDAALHGDGLTSLQYRAERGALTEQIELPVHAPQVLQLERRGSTYLMSAAVRGEPLVRTQLADVDLGQEVYVGLFVCSHNPDVFEEAVFSNVRVIVPAPDDFAPYRDYIGSNLELLEIASGRRTVVKTSAGAMQAPNWTPDGNALIYNEDGLLYRFDLDARVASVIDTGFATRNNNDHVLSFDGTRLGISHHSEEDDGESIVYTLPIEGGVPTRVTARGPSYLHGFSPDGEWLTYTGGRDGNYDIYKIRVTGGDEVRLTAGAHLDDGSEFSPDGEWIYYNSTASGMMQLWRMRTDGSQKEQITDDSYNNWFPHLSPNGESIAFLSYMPEVDPADHPWYKHVYLRLMEVATGETRIVAYVYGGQGTINVPSWSPDGKHLAFVSNTAR